MTTNYQAEAQAIIESMGVTFSATLIGSDCPTFCADKAKGIDMDKVDSYPRNSHIHGKHYRCTFTRATGPVVAKGRTAPQRLSVDFWNSYADEEFNALGSERYRRGESTFKYGKKADGQTRNVRRSPSAYDVLACVQKSDIGTFEDFCGDFGYDTDSRRAESVYHAVRDEWKLVKAFFTEAEIEKLQAIS